MTVRSLIDVGAGTIVATVDIRATRERIFRALTTDEVVQWWGAPEEYHTTGWQADLRVGGAWRAVGEMSDRSAYSVGGHYLELAAPHRIVQSWEPDWDPGLRTRLTYEIDDLGEGWSRLTVRQSGFDDRSASCEAHGAGWERVLSWLVAHLR